MGRKNGLRDSTLPALLLIALLLAGCIGGQSVDEAQDIKSNALDSNDPGLCAAITHSELRDACYIAAVPAFGDVSVCDRCVVQLSRDKCVAATAKEMGDIALCARVRTDTDAQPLRRSCYRDLAATIDDVDGCRWIEDASVRNACLTRFPEQRTEGLCTALDAGELRDDCFSSLAERSGNSTYCEQITGEGAKSTCITAVAHALVDMALCEHIPAEKDRDWCYRSVAIERNDPTICDPIISNFAKDSCLSPIAIATADISLCALISDPSTADECYLGIGTRGWDVTVCTGIQNPRPKDRCLEAFVPFIPAVDACSNMADKTTRESCLLRVALATGDVDVCVNHLGESTKGLCIHAVAAATGDPAACDVFPKGPEREACASQALPGIAPLALCGSVANNHPITLREQCVLAGVRTGKNVTVCPSDIIATNVTETCTVHLAGRLIAPETCASIDSPDEWDTCVRRIAAVANEPALCDSFPEGTSRTWCQAVASGSCERCLSDHLPLPWMRSRCMAACVLSVSARGGQADCSGIGLAMVRDRCLHDLAVSTKDDTVCKEIDLTALRDDCLARVAEASRSVFPCQDIVNTRLRGECTSMFAVQTRNAEQCREIEARFPRQRCMALIARAFNDPSICDDIPTTLELNWCKALANDECTETCSVLTAEWSRELCLYHCAQARADADVCAFIVSNSTRDACVLDIATTTGNDELCDSLADEARAWCLSMVVGDLAACEVLDGTTRDRWC